MYELLVCLCAMLFMAYQEQILCSCLLVTKWRERYTDTEYMHSKRNLCENRNGQICGWTHSDWVLGVKQMMNHTLEEIFVLHLNRRERLWSQLLKIRMLQAQQSNGGKTDKQTKQMQTDRKTDIYDPCSYCLWCVSRSSFVIFILPHHQNHLISPDLTLLPFTFLLL